MQRSFLFFFFAELCGALRPEVVPAMQSDSWGSVYSPVESLSPEIKCLLNPVKHCYGFPGGAVVKNPPAMQETQEIQVWSLGPEDPQK